MKPAVIAHRGASGYLPEHTRPAKVLAHLLGADFIEQDVVATRDDELIVLHDIHLDTVTDVTIRYPDRARPDGRYYVRDFDLAEIRTLTAWERMKADGTAVYPGRYPARTGHYRVHTFLEELQLINRLNKATGRQAGIYPEIKSPAWHLEEGVDLSPLVLAQIREFDGAGDSNPVFVQCFDDSEVRRIKNDLRCRWPIVQLIGLNQWHEADTDYVEMVTPAGLARVAEVADGIGPHLSLLYELNQGKVAKTTLVSDAHDLGLIVHPYTFRSDDLPDGFSSLESLVRFCVVEQQIDGLFTDFADQVNAIIRAIESD
ncbi:MAG: glycerophosphodiester phosphodiesterase [Proteobacteria bacterium]|nr:glycerophosphodiester phosphodiesterase [Pseudomonadota bacterium]